MTRDMRRERNDEKRQRKRENDTPSPGASTTNRWGTTATIDGERENEHHTTRSKLNQGSVPIGGVQTE
jgi:hypothetical protein